LKLDYGFPVWGFVCGGGYQVSVELWSLELLSDVGDFAGRSSASIPVLSTSSTACRPWAFDERSGGGSANGGL
jgi:hypothetical protein